MNKNFNSFYNKGLTHINVGSNEEISIKELAKLIAQEFGYKGKIFSFYNPK